MDYVLIDGDTVTFERAFGAAEVEVMPGELKASGAAKIGGKNMCVAGDEENVEVVGCSYKTPSYPTPGRGTLRIASLAADQKALKTCTDGQEVLLVGSGFTAKFSVKTPATLPAPTGPVADLQKEYSGRGKFINANTTVQGS